MKIQPLSALVGAASLGVVLLTVSAFQAPSGKSPAQHLFSTLGLTINGPVQIEGIPTPSQMVRVVEGMAFTVPHGKVLVVTGLGVVTPATTSSAYATFDGAQVMGTLLGEGCGSACSSS